MIFKWLKNNKLLLFIILLAFLFRVYNFQELFYYGHDNDLAGWFIKDVLVNHHVRLIGQETSTHGIFIGPLFYYLQIPFYMITNMDPIGAIFLVALLGTFTAWSIYFTFSKMWGRAVGFIGAFIHACSFYTIFVEREVVPTMPVFLWTVWFLYALWLLINKKQKESWPLLGVLIGLIWHLNFALVLLMPLIPIAYILKNKNSDRFKLEMKSLLVGLGICVLLSLPLIFFELRHNFLQSNALISALTTNQHDVVEGSAKWVRTFHLASKNVTSLVWGSLLDIKFEYVHIIVLLLFGFILLKRYISWRIGAVISIWMILYISFFSLYSKILSEYYLNGLIILYIAIFAVGYAFLLSKWKKLGIGLLILFAIINSYRYFTIPVNRSGYLYRKDIASEIKNDAQKHNYPCVAVSYVTDPGNDLGYRYFFWLLDMHVNYPKSLSPVYTIVYPLKPIFKEDRTFGALGLIYPDYSRYNKEQVEESCAGENSNLTGPMFGFTE